MIIKINLAANITDMLSYNQKKVEASSEENLVAKVIGTSVPLDENALMYFQHAGKSNKNPNLKLRYPHIKVAVDKSDVLDDYTFFKMGIDTLEGLGIERYSTPYIIYRHYDTKENPHIHIVASRTDYFGNSAPFQYYKYNAMDLSRELELKYDLVSALKKNRDENGIKKLNYNADQQELKDDTQSQFQQMRDIVSDALGTSKSIEEYINDLARNNVSVQFRVEQSPNNQLKIGLSYGLNTSNPEVKIDNPSFSTDWKFINEPEAISELASYRLTTSEHRMYYLNSANLARVNDSHYFAHEFKDFAISSRKLGPGAGWFNVRNKFDKSILEEVNKQLFTTHLTLQNKLPSKKKVWKITASEIFSKETLPEQKALLGIKENNPGYLYEAMKSGVDFKKLLKKKSLHLQPSHNQKLGELVILQKHLSPQEIILSDSTVKQRYLRALNIDFREVDKEEAFNYGVGYITQGVSVTAYDIQFPFELELRINNIKQLEPKEIQKDLLAYFIEGNEEMLQIALRHPKVEFKILMPEFNYKTLKKNKLSESLIDDLEVRIAQAIFKNPNQAKLYQGLLEPYIRHGDETLRYVVKMQNIDFSGIESDLKYIADPVLKAKVKHRIDTDIKFLPNNLVEFQLQLDRAIEIKDTFKMVSYLEMPLLDYSKVPLKEIKHLMPPNEFNRLSQRVERDKARTDKLALFREGHMEVDAKTNRIIPIRVPIDGKQYRLDQEKELEKDKAINNLKDQNIGFSR